MKPPDGRRLGGLCALLLVCLVTPPVGAQEAVGRRFFSDTLVIPEPFVEDELSMPSVLSIRRPATDSTPQTQVTEIGGEVKKRLTPALELRLAGTLILLDPDAQPSRSGFDNLELGLKYQYFTSPAHELVLAAAVGWAVGGTGQRSIGAESFDTVNPALLFGKGLGNLPDALAPLRPLAVTGVLGAIVPTVASSRAGNGTTIQQHPNLLQWGLAIEYSLPYLEAQVRHLGLPAPFNRMFPLVEFDLQTGLDRGAAGKTTGTANPGVVWAGESVQVGVEAVVPLNDRTGTNVGVRGFLRIDLDTIWPGLGRPLFAAGS